MAQEVSPELLAFLQQEETRAYDGQLLQDVQAALDSYNGEPYGDEEEGRSQIVSRDVAEVVDYRLTSIMDVFAGSGRVAEIEPQSEDEEDVCDDATEAMHYLYRKKSGFRVIHDWAKAGLLEKVAFVKTCCERRKKRVEGIIPTLLLPEDMAGIHEAEPIEGAVDELGDPTHYRVVTLEDTPVQFKDVFVPLEEMRFSPDTRDDLDASPYLAHICEKSISELIAMGFDRDQLETVQGDGIQDSLSLSRDNGRSQIGTDRQGVLRKVWYKEEYPLYDLDGDGIAERLMVCRVGNTILVRDGKLAIEEVTAQPFECWCPYPMQGRLIGQSDADKVVDIQRVTTVLERLGMDNLYQTLAPGTFIDETAIGDSTIDDLLNVRPGRIVRYRGVAPIPEQKADISQTAFNAIEFKNRQREMRTGITRLNQGVDEDTLNDTARGQKALMTRGQQMDRYVIRMFGEAVGRLFARKVRLMREYGQPFDIRVDGKFRRVDPSQWPEDIELDVKVGLGSGAKDERIGFRQLVAQTHAELKAAGSPLVTDENIYNNLTGFCKDSGLPANDLYTHPDEAPEQGEPRPDPEMMKAQAELQMQQERHQADVQLKSADLQAKQQEAALKLELERAKAEEAAALARDKAEFEREQAVSQMLFERQLAQQRLQHDMELARYKADSDAEAKRYRDGGRLDA